MTSLGRYNIIDEIGRGGFATVNKDRDTQLNRLVAFKVMHPPLAILQLSGNVSKSVGYHDKRLLSLSVQITIHRF